MNSDSSSSPPPPALSDSTDESAPSGSLSGSLSGSAPEQSTALGEGGAHSSESEEVPAKTGPEVSAENEGGPTLNAVRSASLVRTAAIVALVATILGVVIAPGLHGNADESWVVLCDKIASTVSCFAALILMASIATGVASISIARRLPSSVRVLAIVASGGLLSVIVPSFIARLPWAATFILAITAVVLSLLGALSCLRNPMARAAGIILSVLALVALLRITAWQVAATAGEEASMRLYEFSRILSTIAAIGEGCAQMGAMVWLSTRRPGIGQFLSIAALAVALTLTWGAVPRNVANAPLWQAVLHTAAFDAPLVPPPLGAGAAWLFFSFAVLPLALLSVVQSRATALSASALGLMLLSRGAFDAPLRALCAAGAGVWLLILSDERTMWSWLRDRSVAHPVDAQGLVEHKASSGE